MFNASLLVYTVLYLPVTKHGLLLYSSSSCLHSNLLNPPYPPFLPSCALIQFVSLALDGTTGALQERLKAGYTITPYGLMFAVNTWSIAILGTGVCTSVCVCVVCLVCVHTCSYVFVCVCMSVFVCGVHVHV